MGVTVSKVCQDAELEERARATRAKVTEAVYAAHESTRVRRAKAKVVGVFRRKR